MKNSFFWLFILLIVSVLKSIGMAQEKPVAVTSLNALQEAINKALPGETIILADGAYATNSKILVECKGSALHPVTIKANTNGGVEISGSDGFILGSSSAFVTIQGFKFTHLSGKTKIAVGAHHCRFTRNLFECAGTGAYLTVSGDDIQIDHNTFQNKFTEGQMVSVQGPDGSGMAQRTWIHHNYFDRFVPVSNNCSAIQIGLSGRSMASAFAIVEHNLFVQTKGENENICNKSSDNIYRYNTFGEGVSELSLRHGNRCMVYGNFFIGSEGIRFYGDHHKIFSNYFERCSPAISIGNGDGIIPPDKLVMHDRPDSVEIVFNTLINNRINIIMADRSHGLGATHIVVANNIIQGGSVAVKISGEVVNPIWAGNIIWNTDGVGIVPPQGYRSCDPLLKKDKSGIFRITSLSEAIGKSSGSFPYVLNDMDGQDRTGKPDIGADQLSDAKIIHTIMTIKDAGHDSKQ